MKIVIKDLKDKPLRRRHPWIFSGAVKQKPKKCQGEIYPVYTDKDECLGHAFCNDKAPTIFGRMISWGLDSPLPTLKNSLLNAISLRSTIKTTNAVRLVHAEADMLPGLIVDSYDDHLVVQISTLGMEKLKTEIFDWLKEFLNPKSIYEKSNSPSREIEGLPLVQKQIYQETPDAIAINEEGRLLFVHPREGQKTGFFIDQRPLRNFVKEVSFGKRVLNCFSYTGGFSVAALQGGASHVTSLDSSSWALSQASIHCPTSNHSTICADAFTYLTEQELPYELIILDPPAFAKSQKDISKGYMAYRTMNTLALKKMPTRSILVTCSCSHFIDTPLFQKMLFEAALQAKREIRIIHKIEASIDHPVSPFHPESHYLKSFILYVI